MEVKVIDNKSLFGALSLGDVFIHKGEPYLKVECTDECIPHREGGFVMIQHNAVNLLTFGMEFIEDHTEVEFKNATLTVGGKGEI